MSFWKGLFARTQPPPPDPELDDPVGVKTHTKISYEVLAWANGGGTVHTEVADKVLAGGDSIFFRHHTEAEARRSRSALIGEDFIASVTMTRTTTITLIERIEP